MSIHRLFKVTDVFFWYLTADLNFICGYVSQCRHLGVLLDLWLKLWFFVHFDYEKHQGEQHICLLQGGKLCLKKVKKRTEDFL